MTSTTRAAADAAPATTIAADPVDTDAFGYRPVRRGVPEGVARFTVTSPDFDADGALPDDAWADAFGCAGPNRQFELAWSGAPEGARSFAVTMFDPDAPTGAGFWHWLVWDLPADTTGLGRPLPAGAVAGTNEAGRTGYLGPCPPVGDVLHHYEVSVYALDVPSLQLPADTPPTVAAFTMSGHIIARARLTGTARR
ncbi:YbhB/YbcL family Raf kinase inhibitor-like protein [Kitasatospora sp. MBT63]|uniref:YbhB/YbcL family Raf kinase inhibitor-like protein n=1 Tax=Kitasatospora sp. MBT63 TaxID=1444768 RepID=UPI0009E8EEB9|nr:YbhB/YbcL family Raf kinase inhibitor-like protein [Kitasatospora sp. MBT63]